MSDKQQIVAMLKGEFERWETLLGNMNEQQHTTPLAPSHWTPKDVVAHVWAWQQISIARMEAGTQDIEPVYPEWPVPIVVGAEGDTNAINAWIYEKYRDMPWETVYQNWRAGFLHFIEMAESIPEENLLDTARYPWLMGYPLIAVLKGSYEHHHVDHYPPLEHWLREYGHEYA